MIQSLSRLVPIISLSVTWLNPITSIATLSPCASAFSTSTTFRFFRFQRRLLKQSNKSTLFHLHSIDSIMPVQTRSARKKSSPPLLSNRPTKRQNTSLYFAKQVGNNEKEEKDKNIEHHNDSHCDKKEHNTFRQKLKQIKKQTKQNNISSPCVVSPNNANMPNVCNMSNVTNSKVSPYFVSSSNNKNQKSTVNGTKIRKQEAVVPITPISQEPSTPSRSSKTPPKSSRSSKTPPKSSSSRKRAERIEPHSLPLPSNFHKIHTLVQELRQVRDAPVDSDGASALPETHLGDVVHRFQILIALMLSSQTKDAVVGQTMRALQSHGLTVQNIHSTTPETLNQLIGKVGFHNNKTKYIKQACAIILEKYDGDIPKTAEQIMTLPGVGPKMAYIVESIAYNTTTGIGVDTHMHRIFNQLKWVNTTNPEKTREYLEGFLPKQYWQDLNLLYVGLGQQITQQKKVMLKKAFHCSQPLQALGLFQKLGMDYKKEAKRYGLEDELKAALNSKKSNK